MPTYPYFPALYVVPFRQAKGLPTASFRFHLAMDTLAVQLCTSSLPTRTRDLHPLERAHGAHTNNGSPSISRVSRCSLRFIYVSLHSHITVRPTIRRQIIRFPGIHSVELVRSVPIPSVTELPAAAVHSQKVSVIRLDDLRDRDVVVAVLRAVAVGMRGLTPALKAYYS